MTSLKGRNDNIERLEAWKHNAEEFIEAYQKRIEKLEQKIDGHEYRLSDGVGIIKQLRTTIASNELDRLGCITQLEDANRVINLHYKRIEKLESQHEQQKKTIADYQKADNILDDDELGILRRRLETVRNTLHFTNWDTMARIAVVGSTSMEKYRLDLVAEKGRIEAELRDHAKAVEEEWIEKPRNTWQDFKDSQSNCDG